MEGWRDGGETKPREGVIWWEAGGGEKGGLRLWGVKRLVSFIPFPPRGTRGFFFLKSLFLCCSYFHRRSRASCVCLITSSSPKRVDLQLKVDGDVDNISSVCNYDYDVLVVGLTPTQRCDELFITQHFRDFSRTHAAL